MSAQEKKFTVEKYPEDLERLDKWVEDLETKPATVETHPDNTYVLRDSYQHRLGVVGFAPGLVLTLDYHQLNHIAQRILWTTKR